MTASDTPSITLQPPSGLVVDNPSSPSAPPLFCLFTQDWIDLQGFIAQAVQLPITVGDFTAKYGTFTDQQAVQDCIAAMVKVQGLSADFGDPLSLIQQLANDPTILQSPTAPSQVYTHIVWFATQLYQTATTYNQTLSQFTTLLNPTNCGTKQQCSVVLTDLLTGPGGLQSMAQTMLTLSNALVQHLTSFNVKLQPYTSTLQDFTDKSSTFYKDVLAAITQDTKDVDTFQSAADDAYNAWRDYTIAAVSSSVGLMIITGGLAWPASAALAGVLGDKAKNARDAYDKACQQLADAKADEQKKIVLKADLAGFDTKLDTIGAVASNFLTALQKVSGVWTLISSNLNYIATNFTPEQLGDLSWVMQALKLENATQDWQAIAQKAEEYTANSLVTYHVHKFGDPLPADTTPNS